MATLFGTVVRWCTDHKVHDGHSRYNSKTGETTWCEGTTADLAEALAYERQWSQTYDNDK